MSGNVDETEDGYVLNERGKFVVKFFRTVSAMFGTDERLIYPNENSEESAENQ